MERARPQVARGAALALALVLAAAPAAAGQVSPEDVAAAEAAEAEAAARLSQARLDLAEAAGLRDRLEATIASLASREATAEQSAVAEEINRNIVNINQIAQQTSDYAKATSDLNLQVVDQVGGQKRLVEQFLNRRG